MKKSLTGIVALLAGAFVAHSQGTVSFGNYLTSSYVYVSLKSGSTSTPIGGATSTAPGPSAAADVGNGNEWTVALYGAAGTGDAASTLLPLLQEDGVTPVTATLAGGAGAASPDTVAGTWSSTEYGVVPGTTGNGSATVQVYAWYNDGGTLTSYSAAKTAGVPTGFSATANVSGSLGGPNPSGGAPLFPAALPGAALGNFSLSGGSVVTTPEPSTIALGVMGASAFLLRLRKKQ